MKKHWTRKEWGEFLFWLIIVGILVAHHAFHCPEFLQKWYLEPAKSYALHYLLPSGLHEGCGGFSYISVTTGLNLALVKFEVFAKSVKDIEEQWEKEIEEQLQTFPAAARLDDAVSNEIYAYIKGHVQSQRKDAYDEHKKLGLWWRWLAIRLNVLGLALLFFQHSAGILGLLFVLPVLGSVRAKKKCKDKLNAEIASLKKFADSVSTQQTERQNKVDKTISGAS